MFNIKRFKLILLVVIILMFIFLVSVAGAEQTVRVRGISLNAQSLTLLWGAEEELTATLSPRDATDRRIWWENSNEAVLVLRTSGNRAYIRALGPGESVITATSVDGRHVARCTVTVIKKVTSIGIDQNLVQLAPGETFKFEAWVEPSDASEQGIIWESSDNAVAGVNNEGLVKAVREGEARIIARALDNRDIRTYAVVRVTTEPDLAATVIDEQLEEPPVYDSENDWWPDDPADSTGTTTNYLLYILIAALVVVAAVLAYVLLRRSGQQPAGGQKFAAPVAGVSGRLPVLRGISGLYNGQNFALSTVPLVIGRDQTTAGVVYPHNYDQISRRHLTIYFDPAAENFLVQDTSSNGTFLSSGSRMQPQQVLQPGETLTLANTEETFIVELE